MISTNYSRRHRERGFSFLLAVFTVASILILALAVAPNLLTEGRREREQEMVWRGGQYERAIGLYYRKFGRYPTKIDDLTNQTNGVRFLRKAYTDPMNKDDGSWRLIYVGPNGQLIGSVRRTSLLQSLVSTPTLPGASGPGAGALPPPPPPPGPGDNTGEQPTGPGAEAQAPQGAPGTPAAPGTQGTPQSPAALAPNPLESQPQPLQGDVIGGNIIGVGSKIKTSSLMIYEGGDTYEKWEFIWNPTLQVAVPGQPGTQNPAAPPSGTGLPGTIGPAPQPAPGPGMPPPTN